MRHSIISLILAGLMSTAAIASDEHSGHTDHLNHDAMHEGVEAEATINSIDGTTVNLSHGPIPAIGWPAMTMDLQLLDDAEIGDVAAGQDVLIVLEKGEDGMYAIREVTPMQ